MSIAELQEGHNTTVPWNADEFLYFNGHPLIYIVEKYMNKDRLQVLFPGGKCRECSELISEGNSIVLPKKIRHKIYK